MYKYPDKIWHYKEGNQEIEQKLMKRYSISKLLARLLVNRGFDESPLLDNYLRPALSQLHNSFLFDEMVEAVERVRLAIKQGEKIMIYGDSDVDGVTAASVLYRYLSRKSKNVTTYISGDEGYGLKNQKVLEALQDGVKLIISVDCGITNTEEADFIQSLGMDLIIIDHHESQDNLPKALAIIDAKVPNSSYPFRDLAGVGAALKFVTACFFAQLDEYPNDAVAIDIETTGLSADDAEIIELGAVRFRYGVPREKFSIFIRPAKAIPLEITALTGISDSDVASGQSLEEALEGFLDFIGERPIIGHNIQFDLAFINKALSRLKRGKIKNKIHDSLTLSRKTYPQLKSHKLETLIEFHQLHPEGVHRAYDDALTSGKIYFITLIHTLQPKLDRFTLYFLDLVALGTVADVVPLINENRIFTRFGLHRLGQSPSIGLRMILDENKSASGDISSRDIAWGTAPMLNAAGRIGKGQLSYELLTSSDKKKARQLVSYLQDLNKLQKANVQKMYQMFLNQIEEKVDLTHDKVICLYHAACETGITGVVANKVLHSIGRPTVIITSDDEKAIGSARAFDNIDLIKILDGCKEYLNQFGGHKHAAGFSLDIDAVGPFQKRILELTGELLRDEDLVPRVSIDCELTAGEIDNFLLEELAVLEPFGEANPYPLFSLKELIPLDISSFGPDDRHLRLIIDGGKDTLTAIGWNKGYMGKKLIESALPLDIAFVIEKNIWRNRVTIQLIIEHIKISNSKVVRIYN